VVDFSGVMVVRGALQVPNVKLATEDHGSDVVTSYGIVTTGTYDFTSAATDALKIAPGPKGFVANFAYQISGHRCYERETDGLTNMVAF
jgi:catalase